MMAPAQTGWRTASWFGGCTALGLGVSPLLPADGGPVVEVTRHLLLGMVAPLGLVLAAPVTFLLRSSGPPVRRIVGRILRSALLRVVSHPVVAASLNTGGLYLVMLTPLAELAHDRPWLHLVVHLHYLAAGYLFTWSIAGPDPAPHRPGFATRLGVLLASMAAHAFLAKHLYAQATSPDLRAAAQLMYYGGDAVELLLATALFHSWYRRRGRLDDAMRRRTSVPMGH
jgi:putative membrane protein